MGIFRRSNSDRVKFHSKDRVERGEFRGSTITAVEVPEKIRLIGESAFRECRNLRSVSLPNGVCELGAYAFRDCDMLERIEMPEKMRYPDGEAGKIQIGCFEGCGLLREIVIPEGVAVIDANTFLNCAALETVTLPRSIRAIRSGAFAGCARLKTLNIPVMPDLIALNAFRDTPQQERILTQRKPVLTIMHTSSFGLPEIFQFTASPHLIGTEQTDGTMTVMLDVCDETRICFRIMQYKHAGGSHVVPFNTPTRLFYEEYDCQGRTGLQKEEIVATYR